MKKNLTPNYKDIVSETIAKHYNVRDDLKENSIAQNIAICTDSQLPFSVGVINISGELNIGMMIRSAMLLGAQNFYMFGRNRFDKRSTVGADKYFNVVQYVFDDPLNSDKDILLELSLLPHTVILCEQGGYELGNNNSGFYTSRIKKSPLFMFGSESHGTPQLIIDHYPDSILSIPQRGVLRSFNVSAAMNIICWDYIKENHI